MPPSIPSKHASAASFGLWDPRGLGIYVLDAQRAARVTHCGSRPPRAVIPTTLLQAERLSCRADAEPTTVGAAKPHSRWHCQRSGPPVPGFLCVATSRAQTIFAILAL